MTQFSYLKPRNKAKGKMCEISGSYIIDAKVVDGRAWFLRRLVVVMRVGGTDVVVQL